MPLNFDQVSSSSSGTSVQLKLLLQSFYAIKIILSPFYCSTSGAVQSLNISKKQKFNKRNSCGTRRISLWLGHHFALHYACSITIGVDSISSSSQGCCQGLLQVLSLQVSMAMPYTTVLLWFQQAPALSLRTGSPLVCSFSSGECGNAILEYCYGFNRLHLWLLAQGLLQSVPSFQVSVAMPYYSIVMVSIGSSSGSQHRVSFSQFLLFR